jgi:hypothetical protein
VDAPDEELSDMAKKDPKFENPPDNEPDGGDEGEGDPSEFEAPSPSAAEDESSAEALADLSDALLEVKAAIESQVQSQAADLQGVVEAEAFAQAGNIQGVGVGLADMSSGGIPGEPALVLFTAEPTSSDAAHQLVASAAGVTESAAAEVPVIVQHTGIIDAQPHRFRMRPAPGGISVGHFKITAGTLGCLSVGRTAPRNHRLMILSNNHVLANSNSASIGDCIAQPGPYDGGKCPADQVAVLESFVKILFGGATNYVDCATGWAWPDRVRRELVYLAGSTPIYFRVASAPVAPAIGMAVGKTGRTTQLTSGQVTAVGVTINVNYGSPGLATFKDQIAIRRSSGDFSQGGDSGSLIWRYDGVRNPVGLLFAGGGGTTFVNPIRRVLDALAINLYT